MSGSTNPYSTHSNYPHDNADWNGSTSTLRSSSSTLVEAASSAYTPSNNTPQPQPQGRRTLPSLRQAYLQQEPDRSVSIHRIQQGIVRTVTVSSQNQAPPRVAPEPTSLRRRDQGFNFGHARPPAGTVISAAPQMQNAAGGMTESQLARRAAMLSSTIDTTFAYRSAVRAAENEGGSQAARGESSRSGRTAGSRRSRSRISSTNRTERGNASGGRNSVSVGRGSASRIGRGSTSRYSGGSAGGSHRGSSGSYDNVRQN